MNPLKAPDFVVLIILDGWGLAPNSPGNAITRAKKTNFDRLWASYPHTQLGAAGDSVGLPRGEPGNTETGHLNLGAGRIVYQDLARINMSIADGSFFKNQELNAAIDHALKNNSKLHLMGLIGAGGVHSNMEHLFALLRLCAQKKFTKLYLHLFTDGRDSPPTATKAYLTSLREVIKKEGVGTIATIMGRYWAMDRDQRWERTEKAYFALTAGKGHLVKTPEEAIEMSYSQGKTDEFIEPSVITNQDGKPIATVGSNDAVIFFNFRIDRPRQLTKAFIMKDFTKANVSWGFDPYKVKYEKTHIDEKVKKRKTTFDRGEKLPNLFFTMMTEYGKPLVEAGARVAYPPEKVEMPLGRVLAESEIFQLRLTESEKERFVTFYFNGQVEPPYKNEERVIVPSPKVATYDQKPEMASAVVIDVLLHKLKSKKFKFLLVNFANADMVGHTGNIGPAVKAIEVLDKILGEIENHVLAYNGAALITADHGNAEEMINVHTGQIDTEHSTNQVPFIAISKELQGKPQNLKAGILADIAPTVLRLLNIYQPAVMTGRDLLDEVWKKS